MTSARRFGLALALSLVTCTSAQPPPREEQPPPQRAELEPPREKQPAPTVDEPQAPPGEFSVSGLHGGRDAQTATTPVRIVELARPQVMWTAKVGKTTFRTTMAMADGQVVIGTHGNSLEAKNEGSDGVYVLEGTTGKQVRMIATPGSGDRDVGGVAINGETVYFTADNAQIVAASLAGKVLWKAKASGKVRPAPALADLNDDGQVDVIAGDESGELRALNGKTGEPLWSRGTGTNEYNARGYIGAVAIADLDGDRRDDVVAGARDGILAAYRGSDGSVLWQHGETSGIHAAPTIADFDQDGKPEVLAAWSYGDLSVHDGATGALRWGAQLQRDDGGIEGLFGTPVPLAGDPGVIVAPTAWWDEVDGVILVGPERRMFRAFEGRVTASAVVVDLDGDGKLEAILGTEKGHLLAFTAEGGRAELARLGGPIEAPAMLADVDGDGAQELLVSANDGVLTCLRTEAKARPAISRYRGESPHNRGDLGPIRLGWRSRRGSSDDQKPAARAIRIDYLRCCQDLSAEAARAPAPNNLRLLEAASKCNSLAAAAVDREGAIATIKLAARPAELPPSCQ